MMINFEKTSFCEHAHQFIYGHIADTTSLRDAYLGILPSSCAYLIFMAAATKSLSGTKKNRSYHV